MKPCLSLSPTVQGYVFVVITMCVWGGFSLLARVNAHWGIMAWDIIAIRFGVSALILLPIICLKGEYQFLFTSKAILLAVMGGVGYSCLVYSAFLLAPVAHGAVFLNGMIPVATALLMFIFLKQSPTPSTKIALIIIGLTLLAMFVLMAQDGLTLELGDGLFLLCAFCWAGYGILLKEWRFSAWQVLCSTAIWSAVLYLPLYWLFIDSSLGNVKPVHLLIQGTFHSIAVMLVATFSYALAIERLGAFLAGALASLAPFISALVAVPLLGEPLNQIMVLGLIGMGLGTIQPWRFLSIRKTS